jgi:hypothetical protein
VAGAADKTLKPQAGKRAALVALAAGRLPPGTMDKALPRLRFDKVALRLVRNLSAALAQAVPGKRTLVITVTAPIRLPAQTVAEVAAHLERPTPKTFNRIVCGNRVRARVLACRVQGSPRVIVFVHNPEPPPDGLFRLVESCLGA